jgi:hypothetical protein
MIAFCSAATVAKSSAAAAAFSPPYWVASAETLWPTQFAFPGVPANKTTGTEGTNSNEAAPAVKIAVVNGFVVVISTVALLLKASQRYLKFSDQAIWLSLSVGYRGW